MKKDIDQITKDIFADSKLQLSNPHFNSMILERISIDLERKVKQRIFVVYTLIFMTIVIAVCLVITLFKIDVIGQFANLASSQDITGLWKIILENGYCILPILLLLIGKKMVVPHDKYSSSSFSAK